jgi:coproporphyrinogen III oxidase
MNRHRRMEAKRARRIKRTTGVSRGKVRGSVTRAAARAALAREGERRYFAIGESIERHLRTSMRAKARR